MAKINNRINDCKTTIEWYSDINSTKSFPVHFHDTYGISIILDGTYIENGHKAYRGDIVISHPYEVHSNSVKDNESYSIFTIYTNQILDSENLIFPHKLIRDPFLFEKIYSFYSLVDNGEKLHSDEAQKHIYTIMETLATQYGKLRKKDYHKVIESETAELKNFIQENIESKILLSTLAKQKNQSTFQFIRWFKKTYGLTPNTYIMLNRITHGRNLLREGHDIVNAVYNSGFYDQSHFSKYFKRVYNITPGTYKQQCNILQDQD